MGDESPSTTGLEELDPSTVTGVRYLKRLFPLLERLASSGTERDTAENRTLLFSHYAGLVLLTLFNPTLQSMRGLSQASDLRKVQKALGGSRASTGSLSEAVRVFDPDLLESIFQELFSQLPVRGGAPRSESIPQELVRRLTAVDGSALRALPQIVAAVRSKRGAKWRLHLHFEVHREIPEQATVTEEGGGSNDERSVLSRTLRAMRVYILDRGYERYTLFNDIVEAKSDYVCRAQERTLEVLEVRELTPEARDARVISDERVVLDGVRHPVRRIVIQKRGQGRQRTDKRKNSDTIVLLTNLMDVPAEILAAVYELRWSIELFFRFFKHVLNCRKLLSHKAEGVMIQVYCALIAALLMSLTLGGSVGIRGFELICLYLQGWAEEDELIAGLRRLAAQKKEKA